MKIEFDSDSLEDMKLVRAMLGKRIREREAEVEEKRKLYENLNKSLFNSPDVSSHASIAYSKLNLKNPDEGGDIAEKKKEHRPK